MEKFRTFKCIDHSSPVGDVKMNADMGPVISALAAIAENLKSLSANVHVDVPKQEAPRVTIQQDTPVVHVHVPEIIPQITVAPADVIIRPDSWTPHVAPVVNVNFPIKTISVILSTIPLLIIVDMVFRYLKVF